MSNGDTQTTVVPGQTTGTTPPFVGGADPSAQVSEQTKRILTALAQAAQQKRFAGQPVPAQVPGRMPDQPTAYMTSGPNPHAWGAQRLMYGIQKNIQNYVAKHKEDQIMKATADWEYAQSALNEFYSAQSSGDPNAMKAAQSKVDFVFGDPKKLKNMAKALNQDWMNPEKTTVYGEALKRVSAKTQQTDRQKQQAKQGLMGIFQKLMGARQQPQLTPEQQQAMSREVAAKAPVQAGGIGVKEQVEAAKGILDIEKASKEARENYQMIAGSDGRVWAVNKSNPRDAIQVRDSASGEAVVGPTKAGVAPKVLTVQGVPYGIQKGKDVLTPESENWTADDDKIFKAAKSAADLKQQLRIDPIIAAELGNPPDPKDYKGGKNDTAYGKALRDYGLKAEEVKNRMTAVTGAARAKAFGEYRPVQAINPATGNVEFMFAKDAIGGGAAPAGEGAKLMSKQQQFKEIHVATDYLESAIKKLDRPFDAAQIAKLTLALQTQDEGVARTELQTLAGSQELTPAQQDFVVWTAQINERAMSLRNIAGMGQGAQDLRGAIRSSMPGVRRGSTQMALKQLGAFRNQVNILEKGIPGVKGKAETPADTVNVISPDGTPGTIPRANLAKALQRGYKQAP